MEGLWAEAGSAAARRDIKRRQHFMERSFAEGSRYGLKRARWRGLWRVQIQDYLIATVQNLVLLARYGKPRPRVVMAEAGAAAKALMRLMRSVLPPRVPRHLPLAVNGALLYST